MPQRRPRSSTASSAAFSPVSTNSSIQPDHSFRRPRPRRRDSLLDRNVAALRQIDVDSSDVSVDPASSPTITSFSGRSPVREPRLVPAHREGSSRLCEQEPSTSTVRRRRVEGGPPSGTDLNHAATKGSPWTSDDLERLYRTVKVTRRDLSWATVGDRVGDRTAGECAAKWREVEVKIINFIRTLGEAGNPGDADESASEENDDRFGDDEWEAGEPNSEDEGNCAERSRGTRARSEGKR
ncbi:hypothetical protein CC85DRAFT_314074 [Cutaneotrichosporon oleaginosum]|uniref:Myb-like domain-containing protein n=1 Tax=Cutaneotrichosporon oleaginosum TaxID=879819 RepID=A0A0J1AUX9_9TREE|nr:uncharacterized protein CC85DRAFT_314074 [Cutaneotrichosporon oleaginosum]KLT39089.1 hypothetical protein CC85DRAFT_314074 [Cutaneotrichosporon oleaginosum]TXT08511.1 hypothetical protein COLE_05435 [Cutaneotrichosporon oleaginosum]